jgi:hypothetical protein
MKIRETYGCKGSLTWKSMPTRSSMSLHEVTRSAALVQVQDTGLGSGHSTRMTHAATGGGASPGRRRDSEHEAKWRWRIHVGKAHDEQGERREGASVVRGARRRREHTGAARRTAAVRLQIAGGSRSCIITNPMLTLNISLLIQRRAPFIWLSFCQKR